MFGNINDMRGTGTEFQICRPPLLTFSNDSNDDQVYHKLHGIISTEPVKDYVPYSWISLSQVKRLTRRHGQPR